MIAKHCSGDMEQWQNNFSQMLDLTNDFCGNFFFAHEKENLCPINRMYFSNVRVKSKTKILESTLCGFGSISQISREGSWELVCPLLESWEIKLFRHVS